MPKSALMASPGEIVVRAGIATIHVANSDVSVRGSGEELRLARCEPRVVRVARATPAARDEPAICFGGGTLFARDAEIAGEWARVRVDGGRAPAVWSANTKAFVPQGPPAINSAT